MKFKIVFTFISLMTLVACQKSAVSNREMAAPVAEHSQYKHMLHKMSKSIPKKSLAQQEEFVNRIGKKLVIVSDNPSTQINVKVLSDKSVNISIDEGGNVQLSQGALRSLASEAQLAAILGQSLAKIQNKHNIDATGMEYMVRAGYDANALPAMQETAIKYTPALQREFHYYLTETTVNDNKKQANKHPKGLKTNEFEYQKIFLN